MKQYLDALKAVQDYGTDKPAARENMPGTTSLFGYQMDPIDLSKGFPLLTTKKISFKHIVVELLWFLKGDTNIKYLIDNGVNIWNEDSYAYYCKRLNEEPESFDQYMDNVREGKTLGSYTYGDCGQQYGAQWRNFNGCTDQIEELVKGLRENPAGRRHIVSAWNPSELEDLALHPCHTMFQFNCRPDPEGTYFLDCKMYQRSADSFLGVPYNIASYALLTHIIAGMCGMKPGIYTQTFGDLHLYENHIDQASEQLERMPTELPKLAMFESIRNAEVNEISTWVPELFQLKNYNPQARIKAPLSTGIKK